MARDQDDLEETPAHAESGEGASGAPAQGPGAQADGERAVISRDVSGTIVTGDVTPVTAATPGPDEPPTLDVVLAKLRRLADAVRPAPGEPTQAGLDVVLQRLEREIALLDGRPVPLDALNAVRALVAGGVAGWQLAGAEVAEENAARVLALLARAALWPLVIARQPPADWFAALNRLTTLEVAILVSDARIHYRPERPRAVWTEMAQRLAQARYTPGLLRLLDDLRDPQGGFPLLADALADRRKQRPDAPRDRQELVRTLLWGALSAAAGGVIGNRADALLGSLFSMLFERRLADAEPVVQPATQPLISPIAQPPAREEAGAAGRPRSGPAKTQRLAPPPLAQMQFCLVPAGVFWMGDNDSWWEDERPAYPIDLRYDYWIGRAPVTVAEYAAFVQATRYPTAAERAGYDWTWQHPHGRGSDIRGKHNHPVTQVDWHDALAFCDWLSEVSGLRVQLPSEAEWEKAARGGLMIPAEPVVRTIRELSEMHLNRELSNIRPKSTFPNPKPHRRYPWGDSEPDETRCNIEARVGDTTPVGRYSPRGDSPYGCVDMAGNVLEWCRSKYRDYPFQDDGRDTIDDSGDRRVARGGSWNGTSGSARCACRYGIRPDDRVNDVGVRVVVAPVP